VASVAVSALFGLGGCGIVVPLSSLMSPSSETAPPPGEITGSIPTATATAPVQPDGDADSVRRAIEISVARGVEAPIAWKNDTNGHAGTVTASHASRAPNGAPCRDFETTLTTVSGVDLHTGRICQGFTGGWEVLRFERVGG
jgi:surface antigen